MGMTVPPELHEPFSEETSMYHIHPATEVADEIADLKNQLPSQDDLDAVRASGKRHLSLPGITLAYDEMVGWARTMETVPAITRAVAEMTSGLSGIISVKIEPFSETEEL